MKSKNPDSLFKFMPFNLNTLKTLINQEFYFAKLSELNDPNDCNVEIRVRDPDKIAQELRDKLYKKCVNVKKDLLSDTILLPRRPSIDEMANIIYRYYAENYFGILSFCYEPDSIKDQLMWSHYADASKGICLVFDRDELVPNEFKTINDRNEGIVRYNLEPIEIDNNLDSLMKDPSELKLKYFFYKTKQWGKEKEYRYVINFHGFSPFLDVLQNRYLKFPPKNLKRIFLGEKIEKQSKEVLFRLNEIKGYDFEVIPMQWDRNIKGLKT